MLDCRSGGGGDRHSSGFGRGGDDYREQGAARAYESGQRLRYYRSVLGQIRPEQSIFAVFVAPEGVGIHETDLLTTSEIFRDNDSAASISWAELAPLAPSLQPPEDTHWFIESGFEQIEHIIRESGPQYPREGTRGILAGIADEAFRALCSLSQVRYSRWSGRNCEQILTNKTNVTLWLDLAFDTEEKPPYRPINVEEGPCLRVFLRTQFKLSAAGRKNPALKAWWAQEVARRVFEIPKLGEHHLDHAGWFVRSVERTLPPCDLIEAMTQAGVAVVEELSRRLEELGFSLNIPE